MPAYEVPILKKIILFALVSLLYDSLFSNQLGDITAFNEINNEFEIQTSDGALTKIIFYRPDIFRIWVGSDGILTDPAGNEETPIVEYIGAPIKVNQLEDNVPRIANNDGDFFEVSAGEDLYYNPAEVIMYGNINTLIWDSSCFWNATRYRCCWSLF